MKTQYKLLKDLPGYDAGTEFTLDEDTKLWVHRTDFSPLVSGINKEYILSLLNRSDWFQPLPQPEEEKEWTLELGDGSTALLVEPLLLTEPAAQAVADFIKAGLEYVNTSTEDSMGDTGNLTDKAYQAKNAVQKEKS